jgi:hypothetical protein
MRMMLRWTVPAAKGNEGIQTGAIQETIEMLMAGLQPEAAYFHTQHGERAGMMVFDMTDPAQIPQIAEPLFQALEADVEFLPVMNADDLKRALDQVGS